MQILEQRVAELADELRIKGKNWESDAQLDRAFNSQRLKLAKILNLNFLESVFARFFAALGRVLTPRDFSLIPFSEVESFSD